MPVGTYGTVKAMSPEELAGARRADRARQHLPPVAAPGARGDREARRPAPLHGLGAADPHRLGRLPGVQPRRACARSPKRACTSPRRSTATGCSSRPRSRCASSRCSTPTSPWCSTSARPTRPPRRRPRRRCSCPCAGPSAPGDAFARQPNALFGIVQGGIYEALRDESLGETGEHRHSTAMPSAASRWASRRRSAPASSRTPRRACPRTGRAT